MIIEKIKTWLIALGVFIGAIFVALLSGDLWGRKKEKDKQVVVQAKEEIQQQKDAQQTYKEAQKAAQQISSIPTPDAEKRDDLDTTH